MVIEVEGEDRAVAGFIETWCCPTGDCIALAYKKGCSIPSSFRAPTREEAEALAEAWLQQGGTEYACAY